MNSIQQTPPGYRPDIDGLRAIAVLAVIIFHINKDLLPGGFVGVDVFFVISGYLISQHLFKTGRNGSFSLVDFYFRRIRRIFPAMATVVFTTLVVAQLILLPDDSRAAAKSAVWSVASLGNVYFWLFQDKGYFAASSNELPLLHLWSLGIEEQFYFIWPFVAVALCRWRFGAMMCLLVLVAGASFLLGQFSFAGDPGFAYYMLPSRCGELLVGAIAAWIVVMDKTTPTRRFALPLAATGLAMVLLSMLFLSEHRVFPGLWAIPPTVGAALLILGGEAGNPISRAVATPLLRWIGAISYSAYLWHWPLLAFYRYGYGEPGVAAGCAIFVLTLLLATLTYHYVEQPARHSTNIRWRAGFVGWFAGSVVLAGASMAFVYADRIVPGPNDYHRELASLRALALPTTDYDYVCQRKLLKESDLANERCVLGKGDAPASRVLLMGDSHAAHYVGIVATFAQQAGFRFRNLEVGSCPPVFGDIRGIVDPRRVADCAASHPVWAKALRDAEVVILGASWSEYHANSPRFLPMVQEQVRQYTAMGKQVILLGKVPVILDYDRLCREKALRYPFKQCDAAGNPMPTEVAQVNVQLRRFADSQPNVRYFNVDDFLCEGGACSAYGAKRDLLYFDQHHLSMNGSWELGKRIGATRGVPPVFHAIALAR